MTQWGTTDGYVQASIRQLKITNSQPLIAAPGDLDGGFVMQALRDGIIYRSRLAAEPCEYCLAHPALLCGACQAVMDLASVYRMLANQFKAEEGRT